MMKTGQSMFGIRSMFGNLSNGKVHLRLKTTRRADISGECKMTPATGYFSARKQEGPEPIERPYRIIVSGLMFKFSVKYR